MSKKFDCVKMKHRGAEEIYRKTKQLSPGAELDFWKSSTQKLLKRKKGGISHQHPEAEHSLRPSL